MEIPIDNQYCCYIPNFLYAVGCKLKHLIFETIESETIDEFKKSQKSSKINLKINDNHVTTFYLNLLMELNDVYKYENSFVVKIPHDYTVDEILFYNISAMLFFYVNTTNIKKIRLFAQYTFKLDVNFSHAENIYQDIKYCGQHKWKNDEECTIEIKNDAFFVKGYFIEGNISKIKSLQILFNDQTRFDKYDKMMLQMYGNIITKNLMYLPYNNDEEYKNGYKNIEFQSYTAAPITTALDSIKLKLSLENSMDDEQVLNIYSVSCNFIRYENNSVNIVLQPEDTNCVHI